MGKNINLIEVIQVSKSYKNLKAVCDVNLAIKRGQYVALLGPNGAGKTTLVEMIEGIQKADKGEIRIKGKKWKGNKQELYQLLGISLQETRFLDKVRVAETIEMFASFYGQNQEKVKKTIELVGLQKKKRALVKNLSGGQKQRLALGIALINEPEMLILDEPTTGLDPTARREIWDILIRLKKEKETALILTTHYMEEAAYLCDHIIIMDQGKFLAEGTIDSLLDEQNMKKHAVFTVKEEISDRLLDAQNGFNFCWDPVTRKGVVKLEEEGKDMSQLFDYLKKKNLTVKEFEYKKPTLDDLFLEMTGRSLKE